MRGLGLRRWPSRLTVDGAVAVNVEIATEIFERIEHVLFTNDLSSIHGLVGVGEPAASPAVHAQIQVAHAEDGCLETFSVVKGSPAVLEAFLNGTGDENDVLRVAVASLVEHGDVGLLRSRW